MSWVSLFRALQVPPSREQRLLLPEPCHLRDEPGHCTGPHPFFLLFSEYLVLFTYFGCGKLSLRDTATSPALFFQVAFPVAALCSPMTPFLSLGSHQEFASSTELL